MMGTTRETKQLVCMADCLRVCPIQKKTLSRSGLGIVVDTLSQIPTDTDIQDLPTHNHKTIQESKGWRRISPAR